MNLKELRRENAYRWQHMKVHHELSHVLDGVAGRLCAEAAKARYQTVEKRTSVPWWAIAVIHEREASQSWRANLAQGDPWDRISTHVPRGRGPFKSWEDAAVDALAHCAPQAAQNSDWTSGGTLTLLEEYNGLGYANRGLPSPYIWASTDQYSHGKYVNDGHFDPSAIDHQLGCAALIARMMLADKSVEFAKS